MALKSFAKWAGGKAKSLPVLLTKTPKQFNFYYEPFIGGGAHLFGLGDILKGHQVIINDLNRDLINCYQVIEEHPAELLKALEAYEKPEEKDPETFYKTVRYMDRLVDFNRETVGAAARFIFLNKRCFNGIYRVNKAGHFNSPWGHCEKPFKTDRQTIEDVSAYLKEIRPGYNAIDFEEVLKSAGDGDWVYCDPPYAPISKTANFTEYTADGFTQEDQIRLYNLIGVLTEKGVKVLLSNSAAPLILDLYGKDPRFEVKYTAAPRAINSRGTGRGKVSELVITNYPTGEPALVEFKEGEAAT